MLFTLLPLAQVCVLLAFQYRLGQIDISGTTGDESPATALAVGSNLGGLGNEFVILQALGGLAFLIIAFFAWRGRPESIRQVMIVSVLGLTTLFLWDSITAFFTPPSLASGIDSGGSLSRLLQCGRLGANLLVPIYVLWYMNRAPARAFFRGSYDPEIPVEERE
jgi:hypothetical protein